jgi:membrane protein DedA with SNARE-associated domain
MFQFLPSAEMQTLVQSYGLSLLFGVIMLESVGVPIPSETALVTAALYAGSTHQISFVWVMAVAAVGAGAGYSLGYVIGRSIGFRLIARYGRYVRLTEPRLKIGQYLFLRHGGKIVFFGRFVPFLRAFAALLAGAHHMPWPRFAVVNVLGGITWVGVIGGGSYLLGASVRRIAGPLSLLLFAAALGLVVVGAVYFRRHEQELEQRAAAALPEPAQKG